MLRVVFLGSGEIALPTLRFLVAAPEVELRAVVTQPDKPAGRKLELRPPAIKVEALARGIPVLQPRKLREPAAVEELRAFAPDLIVVMAYGQILPRSVLEMPRLACVNLHASLLPKYRGAAPIQAAILAGERETGITVMYMAEGLDTGDILLMQSLPIYPDETGGSLHDRLALLAPEALAKALPLLAAGTAPRVPQNDALATHVSKLMREDGLLRWEDGWEKNERKIRAFDPWPSAHTVWPDGRQLKIYAATVFPETPGAPGVILRADEEGLLVGTGDGALLLREVQIEGKRRMSAGELLRGNPIAPGTLLS